MDKAEAMRVKRRQQRWRKEHRQAEQWIGTAAELLAEMHAKRLITPPPPGVRQPLRMKERLALAEHKAQGSGRGLHAAAPRTLLATSGVAGPKGGWVGRVGGSTGAWHALRALCYQHPTLQAAFDGDHTVERGPVALPESAAARRRLAARPGSREHYEAREEGGRSKEQRGW